MIFSLPVNSDDLRHYYRRLVQALALHPPLERVALLPVDACSFQPQTLDDCSDVHIGIYLPENGQITPACLHQQYSWDMIIVPSLWLEHQLRIRGIANVVAVLPGCDVPPLDRSLVRPRDGRFVVATSGTLSLHQGHDLILAAMSRFMADHNECWFACCWDLTSRGMDDLRPSPYCDLEGCAPWDRIGFLEHNGIDSARILELAAGSTSDAIWDLVAAADACLSPARVLLGTDTTLSAFRTAGKPTITFEPLGSAPLLAPDGTTVWFEPSVSEILERLESAYTLWREGRTAMCPTSQRSWTMAADELYQVASSCNTKRFPTERPPVSAYTWNKRGAALAGLGLHGASLESYRHALALDPLNPETFNCIGNLMDKQERHQEALLHFDKALALDRRFSAAFFNKATTLKQLQRLDDAIDAYQAALQLDPLFVMGWLNLAVAFALNTQEDKAEACFRRTLELDPGNTDALFLWGNQLLGQRDLEKAIDCYEQVLALEPDHYLACNSMGIAYLSLMEPEKAYAVLKRALLIKPDMTSAMTNIGTACRDVDCLDEAVSWYDRALAIEPDDADTHWNLALALLHQGKYIQGWREYEWRFQKSDKIAIRPSELPLWDGGELKGKTLHIQAEQGYGDTIQFMRYVPIVAAEGNRVILEFQDNSIKPLGKLLQEPVDAISCLEHQPVADVRIPLLSLPFILKTTLDSIPFPGGYLTPPVEQVIHWRAIVDRYAVPGTLRIGFVWDGRKTFRNDKRSIPLEKLTPLFELEGITFVSLQKGEQAQQLKSLPEQFNIVDISEHLMTFADTAALIAGLDLVICVDTSVAHLAGAVGCPTWIMLKLGPDWRWLEQRADSPWYSSVRLYRQQRDGQWDAVVQRLLTDLDNFTSTKKTC
ncbi:MAG: tetratricopeptide repeat protein [Deltaproteobacteria bacterium]|nr:tetratricopeptide repeat protein [Deltaproteobacteria bacterium]